MKPGPRNGLYRTLLEGRYKGEAPETSRRMNTRELNRRFAVRALHRRIHEAQKFRKLGSWVLAIRKRMEKSQSEFARMLGVSKVTIVRWERGLGHMPSRIQRKKKNGKPMPSNFARLERLDKISRDLAKQGIKLED